LEVAGFVTGRRSATDERLVEVYLTRNGADLHPPTACLTDVLLRHSGFDAAQMIELNKLVSPPLRQGVRRAIVEDPEAMDAKPVAD
jgi:MarR family transcriptional regulator, organic hydroperoxide resistance regulator